MYNFVQLSGGVAEEPVKALERMCRLRKIFKMRRLREAMAELVCDRLAQPHPVGSQFSGEYVFWIVWMWSFHKTHAWLNQKRFVDSRRVFYRIRLVEEMLPNSANCVFLLFFFTIRTFSKESFPVAILVQGAHSSCAGRRWISLKMPDHMEIMGNK